MQRLASAIFVIVLQLGATATAQSTGPSLGVRIASGQSTFVVGERVPLQLTFSAEGGKRYQYNTKSYDRSGRMNVEGFEVSPKTGWTDPLKAYFSNGIFNAGGLFSMDTLEKPHTLSLDLNEWVRFDEPGEYVVTVTSARVSIGKHGHPFGGTGVPLRSNPITVRIVKATPEWQTAKLQEIRTRLVDHAEDTRRTAGLDLRYLATPAGIGEMATWLREDDPEISFAVQLGLVGVPDEMRDTALHAMTARMEDPQFAICTNFVWVLAKLKEDSHQTPSADFHDGAKEYEDAWRGAFAELSRKEGRARVQTAETLSTNTSDYVTAEERAQIAAALTDSFDGLSEQQKASQLSWNWDNLKGRVALSTLQKEVHAATSRPGIGDIGSVQALALQRWYELDSEGALREISSEIGAPTPKVLARALDFLPAMNFPQYDHMWGKLLADGKDDEAELAAAELLARFGSGDSAAEVWAQLEKRVGMWSCRPQAAALAYLVKFDPNRAGAMLERALAARGKDETGCYHELFDDIAWDGYGAPLTQVAIHALQDKDRDVVDDAVKYLTNFGDSTALQPLSDRYTKWAADVVATKTEDAETENLGVDLARSLIASQGWLADEGLITWVSQRCVGKSMCGQVKYLTRQAAIPYWITVGEFNMFSVAQYAPKSMGLLEQKIAQFPKGTKFSVGIQGSKNSDMSALEGKARDIVTRNGMTLSQGK